MVNGKESLVDCHFFEVLEYYKFAYINIHYNIQSTKIIFFFKLVILYGYIIVVLYVIH